MKETSPRPQKQLRRPPVAGRKSNRDFQQINKKAGTLVRLFLFLTIHVSTSAATDLQFSERQSLAYEAVFRLDHSFARALPVAPASPADMYIRSLSETIELLLTEDPGKFRNYSRRFEEWLNRREKNVTAEEQFVAAEIRLHWAFIYLKFGEELEAALHLRNAFRLAAECRANHPDFIPVRKTTGLLSVMIGSVPDKYNWLLSLLGLEGSVDEGLADLKAVMESKSPFSTEAGVLHALVNGFILQKPETGLEGLTQLRNAGPESDLFTFLAAALAIKNSQSAEALSLLETIDSSNIPYALYLRGEALLHKADYNGAIGAYREFAKTYRGRNNVKDAVYKTGLCFLLAGNSDQAQEQFAIAMTTGVESSEADKHAARALASGALPNVPLSRARYFTDGGYYREAARELDAIGPADIRSRKDQAEYYYRKARLAHKQHHNGPARLFYLQTIDMCGEEPWYFAPNAALQLAYISAGENKSDEAEKYFRKALAYKKHEYKNSIDTKARSGLSQLKRR